MTTLEILRAARERLSDPAMWKKGGERDEGGARCIDLTLISVGGDSFAAAYAVAEAVGFGRGPGTIGPLQGWNDHPDTTHADVLAALDKAIAAEEA